MLYDQNWKPPSLRPKRWRTILRKAANILEKEGWVQGHLHHAGGYCLLGAITKAEGKNFFEENESRAYEERPVIGFLAEQIGESHHGPIDTVYSFNDDDGKTAEQVIKLLRDAADAV